MNELITQKIEDAANEIRWHISQGVARDVAIQTKYAASTLGPKSWQRVTDLVDAPIVALIAL